MHVAAAEQAATRPRYFVSDLDGTLLRSDGQVSAAAATAITRALDAGHVVSFATARTWISAKAQVDRVPWRHPIIVCNGAIILDPVSGALLWSRHLD